MKFGDPPPPEDDDAQDTLSYKQTRGDISGEGDISESGVEAKGEYKHEWKLIDKHTLLGGEEKHYFHSTEGEG